MTTGQQQRLAANPAGQLAEGDAGDIGAMLVEVLVSGVALADAASIEANLGLE